MTDPGGAPDIRILGGDPTPEELAAVTAVLAAAIDQLAREERTEDARVSTWQRTRRGMRENLSPGAWGTFGH